MKAKVESRPDPRPVTKVYQNCTMTCLEDQAIDLYVLPCEVRIGDGKVVVVVDTKDCGGDFDEFKYLFYEGREIEPGHFKVTCVQTKCQGTLHKFSKSDILEGSFLEHGVEGMWRIRLKD